MFETGTIVFDNESNEIFFFDRDRDKGRVETYPTAIVKASKAQQVFLHQSGVDAVVCPEHLRDDILKPYNPDDWYLIEYCNEKIKAKCVEDVVGGGIFSFYYGNPFRTNHFIEDKNVIQKTEIQPSFFSNL